MRGPRNDAPVTCQQRRSPRGDPIVGPSGPSIVSAHIISYSRWKSIGAPLALRDLGLTCADLDRAAEIATRNPYQNPRPIDRDSIRNVLQAAWEGVRPVK